MTWARWLWAIVGVVGAALLGGVTLGRRRGGIKAAVADERKARAEHAEYKAEVERHKHQEEQRRAKADEHLMRAEVYHQRAEALKEEANAIAARAAAEMPLGERLRRFRARHGFTEGPGDSGS